MKKKKLISLILTFIFFTFAIGLILNINSFADENTNLNVRLKLKNYKNSETTLKEAKDKNDKTNHKENDNIYYKTDINLDFNDKTLKKKDNILDKNLFKLYEEGNEGTNLIDSYYNITYTSDTPASSGEFTKVKLSLKDNHKLKKNTKYHLEINSNNLQVKIDNSKFKDVTSKHHFIFKTQQEPKFQIKLMNDEEILNDTNIIEKQGPIVKTYLDKPTINIAFDPNKLFEKLTLNKDEDVKDIEAIKDIIKVKKLPAETLQLDTILTNSKFLLDGKDIIQNTSVSKNNFNEIQLTLNLERNNKYELSIDLSKILTDKMLPLSDSTFSYTFEILDGAVATFKLEDDTNKTQDSLFEIDDSKEIKNIDLKKDIKIKFFNDERKKIEFKDKIGNKEASKLVSLFEYNEDYKKNKENNKNLIDDYFNIIEGENLTNKGTLKDNTLTLTATKSLKPNSLYVLLINYPNFLKVDDKEFNGVFKFLFETRSLNQQNDINGELILAKADSKNREVPLKPNNNGENINKKTPIEFKLYDNNNSPLKGIKFSENITKLSDFIEFSKDSSTVKIDDFYETNLSKLEQSLKDDGLFKLDNKKKLSSGNYSITIKKDTLEFLISNTDKYEKINKDFPFTFEVAANTKGRILLKNEIGNTVNFEDGLENIDLKSPIFIILPDNTSDSTYSLDDDKEITDFLKIYSSENNEDNLLTNYKEEYYKNVDGEVDFNSNNKGDSKDFNGIKLIPKAPKDPKDNFDLLPNKQYEIKSDVTALKNNTDLTNMDIKFTSASYNVKVSLKENISNGFKEGVLNTAGSSEYHQFKKINIKTPIKIDFLDGIENSQNNIKVYIDESTKIEDFLNLKTSDDEESVNIIKDYYNLEGVSFNKSSFSTLELENKKPLKSNTTYFLKVDLSKIKTKKDLTPIVNKNNNPLIYTFKTPDKKDEPFIKLYKYTDGKSYETTIPFSDRTNTDKNKNIDVDTLKDGKNIILNFGNLKPDFENIKKNIELSSSNGKSIINPIKQKENEAEIKSSETLEANTLYSLSINGNYSYQFTTEPAPEIEDPKEIIKFNNDGKNNSTFSLKFTKPVELAKDKNKTVLDDNQLELISLEDKFTLKGNGSAKLTDNKTLSISINKEKLYDFDKGEYEFNIKGNIFKREGSENLYSKDKTIEVEVVNTKEEEDKKKEEEEEKKKEEEEKKKKEEEEKKKKEEEEKKKKEEFENQDKALREGIAKALKDEIEKRYQGEYGSDFSYKSFDDYVKHKYFKNTGEIIDKSFTELYLEKYGYIDDFIAKYGRKQKDIEANAIDYMNRFGDFAYPGSERFDNPMFTDPFSEGSAKQGYYDFYNKYDYGYKFPELREGEDNISQKNLEKADELKKREMEIIAKERNFSLNQMSKYYPTGFNSPRIIIDKNSSLFTVEDQFKNQEQVNMFVKPVNKYGRLFVPISSIAEKSGMWKSYNAKTNQATFSKPGTVSSFSPRSTYISINGKKENMGIKPIIVNGNMMLPVDYLPKALGLGNQNISYLGNTIILENYK